jgi:hypothetical protein
MLQRRLFAPMEMASVLEKVLMVLGGGIVLLSCAIFCNNSANASSKVGVGKILIKLILM